MFPKRLYPYIAPLLCAFAFTACGGGQWVVPVDPPRPAPVPPKPPTPVPPAPPPQPSAVATFAATQLVVVGMTQTQVADALAVPPSFSNRQDDGTFLVDYPAVDAAGKPTYLSVHFAAGKVVGRATIPRSGPPEPVASLDAGEIECVGDACRLRRCK